MIKRLSAILFLIFGSCKGSLAQFPFERFRPIKYRSAAYWKANPIVEGPDVKLQWQAGISLENGARVKLRITSEDYPKEDSIIMANGERVLLRVIDSFGFSPHVVGEPIRIADINGDGLEDIKFVLSYHGNGIAAMYVRVFYLIQRRDKTFFKISFDDMMFEEMNRRERDMDWDGKYEIVSMALQHYQEHNYFTFNIYNFNDSGIVNVSKDFGYPLMVQNLFRQNFRPARIAQAVRERFIQPHPQFGNLID